MPKLRDIVQKVRSKNAGPFWLTIDIFCGSEEAFQAVQTKLKTDAVARLYEADSQLLKRFEMPDLNVVKISLPRPATQGAIDDRDMHGASWAALLAEMEL